MKTRNLSLCLALMLPSVAAANSAMMTDEAIQSAYRSALIARVTHRPQEAEAILEDLVRARPNAPQLRFDLGVAQAEQGRCAAAARTFGRGNELARTPSFTRAVEAAMTDLCPQLAPVEASMSFALRYDTNANGGAGSERFVMWGLPMTLSPEAVAQKRAGYTLGGSLAYNYKISQTIYLVPSIAMSLSDYEGKDLDTLTLSPGLALRYRGDILDMRAGPSAFYSFNHDGEMQVGSGISARASLAIDMRTGIYLDAAWYDVNDRRNALRDHERLNFGAELVRAFQPRNMVGRVRLSYADWDYTDDLQDLSTVTASIGVSGSLTDTVGFDLALSHSWSEGKIAHPFFGTVRKDEVTTISSSLSFARLEGWWGRPYLGISHTISESSFVIKDYDRTVLNFGLTRRF